MKITPEENPQLYTAVFVDQLMRKNKIIDTTIMTCDPSGIRVVFDRPTTAPSGFENFPALTIEYGEPGLKYPQGSWNVLGHLVETREDFEPQEYWSTSRTFDLRDTKSLVGMLEEFANTPYHMLAEKYAWNKDRSETEEVFL